MNQCLAASPLLSLLLLYENLHVPFEALQHTITIAKYMIRILLLSYLQQSVYTTNFVGWFKYIKRYSLGFLSQFLSLERFQFITLIAHILQQY